jgi:hypothetical protein
MTRILIMSIVSLGALLFAANPHSKEWGEMAGGMRSQTEPHTRAHAKGKTTVHSSDAKPYDQAEGLSLIPKSGVKFALFVQIWPKIGHLCLRFRQ